MTVLIHEQHYNLQFDKLFLMPESLTENINFAPKKKAPTGPDIKDQFFNWVIYSGKRIIIITQIILLIVFVTRFKLSHDLTNLTKEVKANQALVQEDLEIEKTFKEQKSKLDTVKAIVDSQVDWQKKINTINKKIPDDLTLSNLAFTESAVNLQGRVKSAQGFQYFMQLLLEDESVSTIILNSSNYDKGKDEFSFGLNIELK